MATTAERVTPTLDIAPVTRRRLASTAPNSSMPARTERRVRHQFQGPEGSDDGYVALVTCVRCGYADTAHLALSDPEREVIVGLLDELKSRPFMRRNIIRKLDLN